jgi:hypothetical protein
MSRNAQAPGRIVLAALLMASAAGPLAAQPTTRQSVEAPHYGEALFYYYQQNYFTSATRLDVSRHFGRLSPHDDEARLLTGGLYLSYGLHTEAGRIFEELIAEGAPPAVRDRAWFYLAKIRYQRGYLDEAENALSRIETSLPAELDDERRVLHAILLMERGRAQEAVWKLDGANPRSEWAAYGKYNLGVALVRAGEIERGVSLLDSLGNTPQTGDELRSLRDKANVALGYAFLQGNQPTQSRQYLERVRLEGLHANKALLGMGWAWAAEENHERALVAWDQLLGRDLLDSAVQEALIAIPYAFGKVGVFSESLKHYEAAADTFTRELERLDQSIGTIRAGRLIEALERENRSDEMGWFWHARTLPDSPETRYLAQMMAGHAFQEALKNHRDLGFLADNIATWRKNLEVFDDMLDNRRRAHNERMPRLRDWQPAQLLIRLRAEYEELSAQVRRVEQEYDMQALANSRERRQLERLAAAKAAVDESAGGDEQREKLRRLGGVLLWDMAMQYHERLWELKKALATIEQGLDEANRRQQNLGDAPAAVAGLIDGFTRRIRQARERLPAIERRIAALRSEQARQLEALAVAELERQKQRLATYLTQARFSIAQIYDQASRAKEQP